MNYIIRHWKGQLSVTRSYWLSGFLRGLCIVLPMALLCDYLTATSKDMHPGDFILQKGLFGFSELGPVHVLWLYILASTPSCIWWAIGTWRSCNHYNVAEGNQAVRLFVKVIIVVVFAALIAGIAAVVFKTIHS